MRRKLLLLLMLTALSAAGCSTAARAPLEGIRKDLAAYPEYSIILEDMRVGGNFFRDYSHRYKLVWGVEEAGSDDLTYLDDVTDWQQVSKREFEKYANNLGMVIASKSKDGKVSEVASPPGYQYVGNDRYGRWRADSSGNSFWEFYGKYALISHMFNMGSRSIYRNDWDGYRTARGAGRPYYGANREFGTNGTFTKNTNPTFYQRRVQQQRARSSSFKNKVNSRVRRSNMSGVRSRSGRSGK